MHSFWASFGLPAYDENSVPAGSKPPFVTYEAKFDNIRGAEQPISAFIYYRSTSWAEVTAKANEIGRFLARGGISLNHEGGSIWIKAGSPLYQRMEEPNDPTIRRVLINVSAEFLSEF